jgi:hypothetical protein
MSNRRVKVVFFLLLRERLPLTELSDLVTGIVTGIQIKAFAAATAIAARALEFLRYSSVFPAANCDSRKCILT